MNPTLARLSPRDRAAVAQIIARSNGNQGQPQIQDVNAFFFGYSAFFEDTADAASATKQINIQSDSNFLVQALAFRCFENNATVELNPRITVQVTDSSSGMTLYDQPLPISLIAGTAELPFLLPTPRIFPASSTISVTITNNDGGIRDTWLAFFGQKVQRLG